MSGELSINNKPGRYFIDDSCSWSQSVNDEPPEFDIMRSSSSGRVTCEHDKRSDWLSKLPYKTRLITTEKFSNCSRITTNEAVEGNESLCTTRELSVAVKKQMRTPDSRTVYFGRSQAPSICFSKHTNGTWRSPTSYWLHHLLRH
jgi:hypothetical protein